jgi:PIN domain nuclease of toxin-antitoxin system
MGLRDDILFVSAFSFWEIALVARRRRLTLAYPSQEWRQKVLRLGIVEVPLTGEIGIRAAELEGLNGDPADRIIAATATSQGATLLTADERLLSW